VVITIDAANVPVSLGAAAFTAAWISRAAAANCGAVIGGAGIHHARVGVLAIGAVHSFLLGRALAPAYTALKNIYTYSTVIYSGYTVWCE